MAKLFPFRAYRYDPAQVGNLSEVVSQPYDKITPAMQEQYLARHPHNIVRVIKNSNYEEAGRYLNRWIEEGILKRDEAPALYPYEQVFEFENERLSRMGFIALTSLQDADLSVKGHEKVLSGPLEDRLHLIRSTESNEGLIFMLYSDPQREVDDHLRRHASSNPPAVEIEDEYGVIHRLWTVTDSARQQQIVTPLDEKAFYIADGHHRFQTSQLFFQECLEKGWRAGAVESFDKRMIALFNMESPELRILPTHRAVHNLAQFHFNQFLEKLESGFEVRTLESLEELEQCLAEPGRRLGLLSNIRRRYYCLELKEAAYRDSSFMAGLTGPARDLDVTLLHEGILKPLLGIGAEELASQKYVDYYRSRKELQERLQAGEYQLAFFLRPTSLEQVRLISERGEKMPQKSTDFYPKLLTGLTLMKMEIDKTTIENEIRGFKKI